MVKKMVKSIKVMLIPNNKQKSKLFKYANTSRFAYNWAIAREQENYKDGGKFISDAEPFSAALLSSHSPPHPAHAQRCSRAGILCEGDS